MSEAAHAAPGEFTVDAFLDGKVTLVQPRNGHRAGLDAALLQALVPADAAGHAVDLGTGVGTIAFCIAARATRLSVAGIERDPSLVRLGLDALARPQNSAFAGRVRLVAADVTDPALPRELEGKRADWVLMNPPFDPEERGNPSPDRRKRGAHVASKELLHGWVATAASLLKPKGRLGVIHRADELAGVLNALSGEFGGVHVRPVHPAKDRPAIRILVTARRGSGAPLSILPALALHEERGAWTAEADAVLRGRAELAA